MMDQNVFAGQEVNEWLLLHAQLQSGSCLHYKSKKRKMKRKEERREVCPFSRLASFPCV